MEERQEVIEEKIKFIKNILPGTLKSLSLIPDPRQPQRIKHAFRTLMCYGIIMFLYQIASRREANREITLPIIFENLRTIFPEFVTMPHADTLARLLERISVEEIRTEAGNIIYKFIRNKKFVNLLVNKGYTIAIDGSSKMSRDQKWSIECLEKKVRKSKDDLGVDKNIYFAYVVEACFVFQGGIVLPFESEFLEYSPDVTGEKKKDCELKGFKRLVERIYKRFPKLKIVIVADGLFANGPAMALLKEKKWGYMIALKDDSLKTVWASFNENMKIEKECNTVNQKWGNREQIFCWSNEIDYKYEENGSKKSLVLNIVVCEETWEETKSTGEIEKKYIKFAWISSCPIKKKSIHSRCNLVARARWGIESNFLIEKHYGYSYEHCFSYTWNAMKGYHYLMHIAHIINVLMFNTEFFKEKAHLKTMRGLIKYIKETLNAAILDKKRIFEVQNRKHQIRFIF